MPDESRDPNRSHSPPASVTESHESSMDRGEIGVDPLDALGSADEPLALVGQTVGERYRVVELLGKGGMGAVYRAEHIHIRKAFALKVLHRELTHHAEAVKRFEREAIAAARIDHRNIATATDSGRLANGAFYLVLEYVQGKSLRKVLELERRLSERRSAHIASQIASGLAAAHAAGIVHRDLKPDNVMLVSSSAEADFVKVLDFGVAKMRTDEISQEPAITRFGSVFGTPEYMSPEQAMGQIVDARTDLYALGIMLYEMLVGETPFADEQLVAVLSRQIVEAPRPLPAQISPEIARLIMQLLEKQPDARPSSAERVAQQLEALVPTLATRPLDASALQRNGSAAVLASSILESGETLLARSVPACTAIDQAPRASTTSTGKRFSEFLRRFGAAGLAHRITGLFRTTRPRYLVLATAGAAVVVALSVVGSTRKPHQAEGVAGDTNLLGRLIGDPKERQLRLWMEQARAGDSEALRQLEARPDAVRGAAEWAALGAGRIHAKQWGPAVAAYARACDLDAQWGHDTRTLSDLYQAALEPQTSRAVFDLASTHLGELGADLIYAVIDASPSGRAPKVDARKARTILDSDAMASKLSSALRTTLRVERSRSCSELKSLLAGVEADGDQRTYRAVQRKLSQSRGCGFLGLADCYSCVRGTKTLAEALDTSKARSAPSFSDGDGTTPGHGRAR